MMSPDSPASTLNTRHVLVIAGMHRSGTSLVANWLAQCRLDVGGQLIPSDWSNPAGHYEDVAFSQLQRDILRENGTDHLVADRRVITVSQAQRARAGELINERADCAQWGWKDPRTALLLDFWRSLLPDMKTLVVYRPYAQVAGSLLRREKGRHRSGRLHRRAETRLRYSFLNLPLVRRYLQVWNRYNQDILAFVAAHPESCLVFRVDVVVEQAEAIVACLNREWGFSLHILGAEHVYDPALLKTGSVIQAVLASWLCPACRTTYRELGHWEQVALQRISSQAEEA